MKNNQKLEIVVSLALILATIFLVNPWNFSMSSMMHMTIITVVFVLFTILTVFVLKESVQDEREIQHRMLAGRVAFLAGSAVLIVGILVQSLSSSVDIWLVIALITMIFSKFFTRVYSDRYL